LILAEDGKKMSKRLKNYPEPENIINKYGADALRLYLAGSPAAKGEELRFSEKGVAETLREMPMLFWNVFLFWKTYAENTALNFQFSILNFRNILDRWILARLNLLIQDLTETMEAYDLPKSIKLLKEFINDLSTWYVRRSRERFKDAEAEKYRLGTQNSADDSQDALNMLGFVLLETSKLLAPFAPFLAEKIYLQLKSCNSNLKSESVHLESWPKFNKKFIDEKLLEKMQLTRQIVSLALEERANIKIPVRQVLQDITISGVKLEEEYLKLIKEEVNVKEIKLEKGETLSVIINPVITPELRQEGIMREIIRQVNSLRKDAGLTIKDKIILYYETDSDEIKKVFKELGEKIANQTVAKKIEEGKKEVKNKKLVKLEEGEVWIGF
jgi:isoleucyl-tRNA synthetase